MRNRRLCNWGGQWKWLNSCIGWLEFNSNGILYASYWTQFVTNLWVVIPNSTIYNIFKWKEKKKLLCDLSNYKLLLSPIEPPKVQIWPQQNQLGAKLASKLNKRGHFNPTHSHPSFSGRVWLKAFKPSSPATRSNPTMRHIYNVVWLLSYDTPSLTTCGKPTLCDCPHLFWLWG